MKMFWPVGSSLFKAFFFYNQCVAAMCFKDKISSCLEERETSQRVNGLQNICSGKWTATPQHVPVEVSTSHGLQPIAKQKPCSLLRTHTHTHSHSAACFSMCEHQNWKNINILYSVSSYYLFNVASFGHCILTSVSAAALNVCWLTRR